MWEALTAIAHVMAGSDLLIMRHPEAAQLVRRSIVALGA